jgi:hypothetical protein
MPGTSRTPPILATVKQTMFMATPERMIMADDRKLSALASFGEGW